MQHELLWKLLDADDNVLEEGAAEHFDNIRNMQRERQISRVVVDSAFRTQEVFEAAHAYGWETSKSSSQGTIKNPHLITIPQQALVSVINERQKQNQKWGEQNHDPIIWSAILNEETGEFAQAALHHKFGGPAAAGLREEAVHCAAVALQIIEWFDRTKALSA